MNRIFYRLALMAALMGGVGLRAEIAAPAGTNAPAQTDEQKPEVKKEHKALTPEEKKKREEHFQAKLKELREKKTKGSLTAKEEKQLDLMEKREAKIAKRAKHPEGEPAAETK